MSDDDDRDAGTDAAPPVAYFGQYGPLDIGTVAVAFSGPELTPPEKRALFHSAIARLTASLDSYEQLAGALDLDDERIIDASTEVQRALRSVQIEHVRATGGPFPQSRDEPVFDDSVEPEGADLPSDYERVPPLEFAAVVPLDIPMVNEPHQAYRIREARAYSTGVMVVIEGFASRRDDDWPTWRDRSRSLMDRDLDHPLVLIAGRPVDLHGGGSSSSGRQANGFTEFWIPAPLEGDTLSGEYRLTDAETLAFTLDATLLREAQSRARPL